MSKLDFQLRQTARFRLLYDWYPLQGTPTIMKLFSISTLDREVLPLQDSEELVDISEFKPVAGK